MKAIQFILLLFCGLLLFFGNQMASVQDSYRYQRYQDSIELYEQMTEVVQQDSVVQAQLLGLVQPPQAEFQPDKLENSHADPYMSASQGVEVTVEGLAWRGRLIDTVVRADLFHKYGADYVQGYNKLFFDPDFPECGYPNLNIKVPDVPTLYVEKNKDLSRFIRRKTKKAEPIESFYLTPEEGKRIRMDYWVAEFDIAFRIEPDRRHSRNEEFSYSGIHPITRIDHKKLRRQEEYKNQRYDGMTLFLGFNPKKSWYIGTQNDEGIFQTDAQPSIGIAGVECYKIVKVGEKGTNNEDDAIGISVEKGEALPLYNSLDEVTQVYTQTGTRAFASTGTVLTPNNTGGVTQIYTNPNLFDKSKFSAIRINNIGSWRTDNNWFLGKREYEADFFQASFYVHLYVLGEWTVKGRSLVAYKPHPPTRIVKSGLFSKLLPDFNLGILGRGVSVLLIGLLIFVVLSFFISPIGQLLSQFVKRINP